MRDKGLMLINWIGQLWAKKKTVKGNIRWIDGKACFVPD